NVSALADAIAPFGPPGARAAADRIRRVVAAHPGGGSQPPPEAMAPVPTATASAGAPPGSPAPAAPAAGMAVLPRAGQDQGSLRLGAMVAAVVIAVGLVVGFVALRRQLDAKGSPAAAPSSTASATSR